MNDFTRQLVGGLAALAVLFVMPGATTASEAPEVPESAYGEGAVEDGNPHVESRLLFDKAKVEAGGEFQVGVLFSMDPDWHIYWRNSGDAGMSTTVEWKADGVEFGDLHWPAPHAFEQKGEIYTFGYSKEVLLFTTATASGDAEGDIEVTSTVDYLACKVDCIPGSSEMSRSVEVAKKAASAEKTVGDLFETFASKVPKPPEEIGIEATAAFSQKPLRPGDTFQAGIGLNYCPEGPKSCADFEVVGDVEAYRFIPDATSQISWKTTAVRAHPSAKEGEVLVLEGEASPNSPDKNERLGGVVHLEDGDGEPTAVFVEFPLERGEKGAEVEKLDPAMLAMSDMAGPEGPAAEKASAASAKGSGGGSPKRGGLGLLEALLFAFLGGMILNLMPCVFPVLALKVTSFAELVHEDRTHKAMHGVAYTAGIVGSLLLLAAVVLVFRAVGTNVGWGFQFQNPVFPAVLGAVVTIFALNIFGVFEVRVESTGLSKATNQASGLQRSAAEGVLAVVLATPCSAPFLGTAVGFALTGSALTVVGVFAMLGLGLAAPFVVLTMVPGWSKVLPNPGPWMEHIKHFLGFALIGAAIWLVWIVGRTTGADGMAQALAFIATASLVAWVFGEMQHSESNVARVLTAISAVALVGVGAWALQFPTKSVQASEASSENSGAIAWKPWSEERVDRQLAKGRPVFVDFTADWCITCKVNERTVLSTEKVLEGLETHDVATFKADWTDGDETIRKKLEQFGKAGVPMYLVYSPAQPEDPTVLPEVLTPSMVADALEDAASERARN